MSVAWHNEDWETGGGGGGGRRRRPRLAGGRLISTESLTDICSGRLRWSWAPRLLFVWALHIINQLYQKKKTRLELWPRLHTRAHTLTQPPGRERRVTAASRSPLLIAATLVNESISTGPGGAAPQPQRYLYVAFYFLCEPLLNCVNLNRADRPGRKWNSKSHRASGQFSK